MRILLLGFLVLVNNTTLLAVDNQDIGSIIDQLEGRLNSMESNSLGIPEDKVLFDKSLTDTDKDDYVGSTFIQGSTENANKVRDLAIAINILEGKIDTLSSEVQKTKNKVLENARMDNFIELNAQLEDTNLAAINSLKVSIDGYEIYDVEETSGFWLPVRDIPLYTGPITPGNHKVSIESRIVLRHRDSLPLNNKIYQQLSKDFEISIPSGSFKKKWTVGITPPSKEGDKATIDVSQKKL